MAEAKEPTPVRFDIPSQATILGCYRAFRKYAEAIAKSQGKTLAPSWYEDCPEERPELYKDQPHLLRSVDERDLTEPSP